MPPRSCCTNFHMLGLGPHVLTAHRLASEMVGVEYMPPRSCCTSFHMLGLGHHVLKDSVANVLWKHAYTLSIVIVRTMHALIGMTVVMSLLEVDTPSSTTNSQILMCWKIVLESDGETFHH